MSIWLRMVLTSVLSATCATHASAAAAAAAPADAVAPPIGPAPTTPPPAPPAPPATKPLPEMSPAASVAVGSAMLALAGLIAWVAGIFRRGGITRGPHRLEPGARFVPLLLVML